MSDPPSPPSRPGPPPVKPETGLGADLAAVVASATDAIVTADERGRILTWNAAAGRIFGHEAGEVVGRPLSLLMPERFREAHDAGLARVVRTGETRVIGRTVELAGLRRDGSKFPVELSLSTWTSGDGDRFFAGIVRDVSDRVRLMRELTDAKERMAAILEYETPRDYADAVSRLDGDAVARAVLEDCHRLSALCARKFAVLRWAMWSASAGLLLGLAWLLLFSGRGG